MVQESVDCILERSGVGDDGRKEQEVQYKVHPTYLVHVDCDDWKMHSQCSDLPSMQSKGMNDFCHKWSKKIQQAIKHSWSTINQVCAWSLLWESKQWGGGGLMHLSSSTHDSTEMFSVQTVHILDPTFIFSSNLKVLFQGKWMPVNENEYATSWILGMCVQWFLLSQPCLPRQVMAMIGAELYCCLRQGQGYSNKNALGGELWWWNGQLHCLTFGSKSWLW